MTDPLSSVRGIMDLCYYAHGAAGREQVSNSCPVIRMSNGHPLFEQMF